MSLSKVEADVLLDAKKRWETDASLRRMHHCGFSRAGSAEYENGLHKYCKVVLKDFRDNQKSVASR